MVKRQLVAAVVLGIALAGPAAASDRVLEARIDGLMQGLMATHHVPGAVLIVLRDGRVIVSRGYGVADVDSRRAVDPERTRFRVASNSKLFVATAVMQQVERGRLDLDADVNDYLEVFQLENAYGEPVTLRNLLTHTGGFDDRFLRTAQPLDATPPSLGDYLATDMPPRVRPPGRLISYSNHGYALAGHIVEQVAGVPFAEYVRREIFEPLGMDRSSFGIPTPVPDDTARGYVWRGGRHVDLGYDRLLDAPAGDLLTTASDMARFLLAHMQGGEYEGATVLRPETVEAMHREQITPASGIAGWTLGFAARQRGGVRAIGHGGSWRGFGTSSVLVPEADIGWFVSTNHDFHARFMKAVDDGLWEILVPTEPPSVPSPPADFAERAGDYTGSYVPNRRVRSTILKLGDLISEARITADDDGSLWLAPTLGGPDPIQLVETGTDRFVSVRDGRQVAFARDDSGRIERLFVESWALDRLPAAKSPRNHAIVALLCTALFVGTLVGWALGAVARRVARAGPSPVSLRARVVGSAVALLLAATLAGLIALAADPNIWGLMEALPTSLVAAAWAPLMVLPLVPLLAFECVRGFRAPAPLARLHYALLVVAAVVVLTGAFYWNVVPWKT